MLPTRADPQATADRLVLQVAATARAGVHLVQIRERDLEGGALLELVRRCLAAVRDTATRILVNDRLDVALAAGAHGVHLRGDSMPASRARLLAPRGFLIGRSVHSPAEAIAAARDGGCDYLLFGPVFATRSKPGVEPAGPDALASVVRAVPIPVLAVGGVNTGTIAAVARAGAAGAAAIGMFAGGAADAAAALAAAARAFDTPHTVT